MPHHVADLRHQCAGIVRGAQEEVDLAPRRLQERDIRDGLHRQAQVALHALAANDAYHLHVYALAPAALVTERRKTEDLADRISDPEAIRECTSELLADDGHGHRTGTIRGRELASDWKVDLAFYGRGMRYPRTLSERTPLATRIPHGF